MTERTLKEITGDLDTPIALSAQEETVHNALRTLSDNDLLLELRLRGRLGRVERKMVIGGHHANAGYPEDRQVVQTFQSLGFQLGEQQAREGISLPGCSVKFGHYNDGPKYDGMPMDRMVTAVVIYFK